MFATLYAAVAIYYYFKIVRSMFNRDAAEKLPALVGSFGLRLAVRTRSLMSELVQVGSRFGVHAQCPGDRVEDFGGGVSVAALLQALQVLAADAGQQGQFVTP